MRKLFNQGVRLAARHYPLRRWRGQVNRIAMRLLHGRCQDRDAFGNCLELDLDSFLDCYVFLHGSYEGPSVEYLRSAAAQYQCQRFIDVGANIGLYTLAMAQLDSIQRCDAFEPDPRTLAQLQKKH